MKSSAIVTILFLLMLLLVAAAGFVFLLQGGLRLRDEARDIVAANDTPVSYTHLRAHETVLDLVCRLLLEKKNIYVLFTLAHVSSYFPYAPRPITDRDRIQS